MEADPGGRRVQRTTIPRVGTDRRSASSMSQGSVRSAGPLTDSSVSGCNQRAATVPIRRAIPTDLTVCELEVTRKPAMWWSTAISWSMISEVLKSLIVRGRSDGGVVQGLGQALMEHQVYDRQSGQPCCRAA